MLNVIKCDDCGKLFTAGNNEDGLPNGVGFQLEDGTIHNVCNECLMTFENKIKPRSNKTGKVKMNVLHIPTDEFDKVMTNMNVIEVIKKCNGYASAVSKNPILYCSTLLFQDKEHRKKCAKKLEKIGVKTVIDDEPAYIERKWLP